MIRIIYRNLNKKKLVEKKWDFHLACFHFKNYKNCYINGKPLKPYNLLKNGDVIEIIKRPADPISSLFGFFLGALSIAGLTGSGLVVGAGVLTGVTLAAGIGAVAAVGYGIASIFSGAGGGGTTQAKEYSSSTQPELRGASNDISDGCLPVVFGKTQQTPSYGQLPYRLVVDGASTNKYRQYFVANYNNVVYSNFKLGETPRTDYSIDYLDIISVYGQSNFIGFDNVKAVSIDEELSYNPDEEVNFKCRY